MQNNKRALANRRFIYISDPSSIARLYLPKNVEEKHLRDWVDDLSEVEVDTFIQEVYTQGWTTYWKTPLFEYDARPQHKRFLPLIDSGVQPLDVLIDQSHKRGIEFLAGMRVNDNHGHVSVSQGVGSGSSFISSHPQWLLNETRPDPYYQMDKGTLDFTFDEVREYVSSVAAEIINNFDIDGIELCFRDRGYFPYKTGNDRKHLMTEFVASINTLLTEKSKTIGRDLVLGVRVCETISECLTMGLDVSTWIKKGLIDYVSPQESMHSSTNAPVREFADLIGDNDCELYPAMQPWTSIRMRRRNGGSSIKLEQQYAILNNYYGEGADGFSVYNHFVPIKSAPFYPMQLQELLKLKEYQPGQKGFRRYTFDPMLHGQIGYGESKSATGAVKNNHVLIKRNGDNSGTYSFKVYESFKNVKKVVMWIRAFNMTLNDHFKIRINDILISDDCIKVIDDEQLIDVKFIVDPDSKKATGLPPVPDLPEEFCTLIIDPKASIFKNGNNVLALELIKKDADAEQDILVDEIEVFVVS